MITYLYLHGFASGPSSSKAQYFATECVKAGVDLQIPRLDGGDFERMTITSQLRILEQAAGPGPVRLIGSSLGGWLAALYAAHNPRVERIVLLAPAFGFVSLFSSLFGPEKISEWQRTGRTAVFHYGSGEEKQLAYGFFEDAQRHPQFPDFAQPGLILHGLRDDTVPVGNSIEFAKAHRNVKLVTFESGHELTNVTSALWRHMCLFFDVGHNTGADAYRPAI